MARKKTTPTPFDPVAFERFLSSNGFDATLQDWPHRGWVQGDRRTPRGILWVGVAPMAGGGWALRADKPNGTRHWMEVRSEGHAEGYVRQVLRCNAEVWGA